MSTFLTLTGSSMINDDSSQQTESHSSQSRHTPHLHQSQFVRSKRSVVAETLELPRRSVPLQQQEDVESSRASGARVRGSGSSIGKRVVVPNDKTRTPSLRKARQSPTFPVRLYPQADTNRVASMEIAAHPESGSMARRISPSCNESSAVVFHSSWSDQNRQILEEPIVTSSATPLHNEYGQHYRPSYSSESQCSRTLDREPSYERYFVVDVDQDIEAGLNDPCASIQDQEGLELVQLSMLARLLEHMSSWTSAFREKILTRYSSGGRKKLRYAVVLLTLVGAPVSVSVLSRNGANSLVITGAVTAIVAGGKFLFDVLSSGT